MSQFLPCSGIQCIIPPHILETIQLRGNVKQRKMAKSLLTMSENVRNERQVSVPVAPQVVVTAVAVGENLKPKREIYDGKKKALLPGTLVRKEGEPEVKDIDVNRVYDGAGDTYNLYLDQFQRDSLDGKGMKLMSTVHHRYNYNNALWNSLQMAYGDGDGALFRSFTSSLSVIGHELSHGVVQFSGGLIYQDQSGALNESFADIFGALTVQYKKRQEAHEADWLIGDGMFGPNINGDALRSMKAPGTAYDDPQIGKDPQPYHLDDYMMTNSHHGAVHINSGIPNHAFYLLSQYLGGYAWESAGRIWYDTMQSINNPRATFHEWADKTVEMAMQRYGTGSSRVRLTKRAWKLVGINI